MKLIEILPDDLLGFLPSRLIRHRLSVPGNIFFPGDRWTRVFLRGLCKLATNGGLPGRVHEVGVGAGLVSLFVAGFGKDLSFSDLQPDAIDVAESNIFRALKASDRRRVRPVKGSTNLLSQEGYICVPKIGTIIGCIPQVPADGISLQDGDNMAHYYRADAVESRLNTLGLGLNDGLLAEAVRLLPRGGKVVLNLGGRPGLATLVRMFQARGYRASVVYRELVDQDPTTSLKTLAALEAATGHGFEFFSDFQGRNKISAVEAEKFRLDGRKVFHYIYVVEGVLT